MNSQENIYIFIDESGTVALPKDNDLDYYTIVAITVPESKILEYKLKSQKIIDKYTKGGQLKSSNISDNRKRRIEILSDIKDNDFSFYCLVVNKSLIFKESGLRFKQTSYKFLHKLFYQRIRRSFFSMNIVIDNFGTDEFMESFIKYIQKDENLFTCIEYKPCKDEPLLQISDFIAGTIRRIFLKDDPKEILSVLNYPYVPIEEWPPTFLSNSESQNISDQEKYNSIIRSFSITQARLFLQSNNSNDDIDFIVQSLTLRYLMQKYYTDPTKYIFRNEIIEYLKIEGIEISEQELSTKIIAKLRDGGVLIVSTDKGIKIPFDSEDIKEWIDRIESQVVPYLKRLEKARNALLIATYDEYDIVYSNNNLELMKYLSKI